jgi:hypothetical protein
MLDRLSTDTLTNDILNAIIRRTRILLSNLEQEENVEYYEGERFIWNLDNDYPTLSIDYHTHNSTESVVNLWWNKEIEDDKFQVYSNIIVDARENLSYYMSLEKIIYDELDILCADMPLSFALPGEYDDDEDYDYEEQ